MTLKDVLEATLLSQRVTLKRVFDSDVCSDQILLDEVCHENIPYAIVAEFLASDILTVEARSDPEGHPYLYLEI